MGQSAEALLDQLVTWRELGLVFSARTPAYDEYESLPDWARETLGKVRSMSSDATRRKVSVTGYLERFAEEE